MTSLADSDPSAHSLANSLLHSLSTHLASADKTTESPLAFVSTLKQIQRLASSHVVAAKSETASVRLDMDRKGLDLMGLEYERKRIQSEIIRAQAFDSIYQTIDLTLQAPADATSSSSSLKRPERHDEILAALSEELASMEQLQAQKTQLLKQQDSTQRDIKDATTHLQGIDIALAEFGRAGTSIQSKMQAALPSSSTV